MSIILRTGEVGSTPCSLGLIPCFGDPMAIFVFMGSRITNESTSAKRMERKRVDKVAET